MKHALVWLLTVLLSQSAASAQSKLETILFLTTLTPAVQLEKEGFTALESGTVLRLQYRADANRFIIVREEMPCKFGITRSYFGGMAEYSFVDMNNLISLDFYDDQQHFDKSSYIPDISRKIVMKFSRPSVFIYTMAPEQIDTGDMQIESVLRVLYKEQKSVIPFDEFSKSLLESEYEIADAKTFFPKIDVYKMAAARFRNDHCRGRLF